MIYKGELAIEWDRVKEGRVGYDRSGEERMDTGGGYWIARCSSAKSVRVGVIVTVIVLR